MSLGKLFDNKKTLLMILVEIMLFLGIYYFAVYTYNTNIRDITSRNDIGVEFRIAGDLLRGINPYNRITESDLLKNQKFATLLPTYYYILLAVAAISSFSQDIYFELFRHILYVAQFFSALFIYKLFRNNGYKMMGFAAVGFFLLNRWVIDGISDLKQDSLAIALLIASIYFFRSKDKLSYFLFGMSLGIKHLGIMAFPIYLLPFFGKKCDFKKNLINLSLLMLPIVLPALVFITNDFKSFFLSMIFSLTRAPATNSSVAFGYEHVLIKYNPTGIGMLTPLFYMLPRIILIGLGGVTVLLLFLKRLKVNFYLFAIFLIFATFNPVVYDQYLVWVMPFVFFSLLDFSKIDTSNNKE